MNKVLIFTGCSWVAGWNEVDGNPVFNHPSSKGYNAKAIAKQHANYSIPSVFQEKYPDIQVINLGQPGSSSETAYVEVVNRYTDDSYLHYDMHQNDVVLFHCLSTSERTDISQIDDPTMGRTAKAARLNMVLTNELNEMPPKQAEYFKSKIANNTHTPETLHKESAYGVAKMATLCNAYHWDMHIANSFDARSVNVLSEPVLSNLPKDKYMHNHPLFSYETFCRFLVDCDNEIHDEAKMSMIDGNGIDPHSVSFLEEGILSSEYLWHCGHPNVAGTHLIATEIERYLKLTRPDFLE